MFSFLTSEKIIIATLKEGFFKVIITTKEDKTVFSDFICSKNKQIILKGFSKKSHSIKLESVEFNTQLKPLL
jgi:5-formaminoimidazole-4-carboxamide-1-beta-D-ribofuranosyl 5'-monophosphate synthetase